MDIEKVLFEVSIWVIPILVAVTLHEAAHGWVAWKLGDDTAYRAGRVTFNPFRHIDPFGTALLPALLLLASGGRMMFGYAKPVPVDFGRLRNPRFDMVLVAAAGPATNFALAFISAALILTLPYLSNDLRLWVGYNLFNSVWINLLLCVFNMIPLPPLDGGRVAIGILPNFLARPLARMERLGFLIILGALFVLPWAGDQFGLDLNVFSWLVASPAVFLNEAIFSFFNLG
jgi:Zn-dependent protease